MSNGGESTDPPRNVTLTDVAAAAGVSLAAASRALNGREGVRAPIRKRVQVVAESLGYRPDRAAKNFVGGGASVIGVLLGVGELQSDRYGASLLQAIADAAEAHQEGLMVVADTSAPSAAALNLVRDGLMNGIIITESALGERWVEELLDAKIPTVMIGAHPCRSDVCVVGVENRKPSEVLVGHMLDTGCARVATVTGPMHRVDASQRMDGYRNAHAARGLAVDEGLIFEGDYARRTGWEIADQVLAAKPGGVFCANDQMALGLYKALMERGIAVPDEVSLAGFDGTSLLEFGAPDVTSAAQPFDQLADVAIKSIKSLVLREPVPFEQLVTPELIWGETTR